MYIAIGIASALAALFLLSSYLAFRRVFLSKKEKHASLFHGLDGEMTDLKIKRRELLLRMIEIPYEDVWINAHDGARLHGRYYHVKDGAPLAIQFHGYKSLSVRDFSGGAYECLQLSHNVLLIDQRAHGESDGAVISFGIKERYDAVAWSEYAVSRFGGDVKIVLYGVSMGAATVLMASELNLPKNVVGIVADCPYSSPRDIIKKVCRDMKLPAHLVYPLVRAGAVIFGGFDPDRASPKSAVSNTDIPILLIHGEADGFVPCSMSDEIAEAGKTVSYVKIKDATHALSMLYDRDGYMKAVTEFINKIL